MPGTCLAGLHTGREMLRYRGFLGPLRCMQLATEHRSEESHDVADESLVIGFLLAFCPRMFFIGFTSFLGGPCRNGAHWTLQVGLGV